MIEIGNLSQYMYVYTVYRTELENYQRVTRKVLAGEINKQAVNLKLSSPISATISWFKYFALKNDKFLLILYPVIGNFNINRYKNV